jgi:flagellar basal-body rod modification protein FlgD
MTTNSATATQQNTFAAATGNTLGKDAFLQLLLMQLRNQDPLNPMNDREFITQMAQLSSLEATQGLNSQVDMLILAQMQTQALQMVDHNIEYLDENGQTQTGKVTGVRLDGIPPKLVIGDKEVPITNVQKVL